MMRVVCASLVSCCLFGDAKLVVPTRRQFTKQTTKVLDATIMAAGAGTAVRSLTALEARFPGKFFLPPMLSSTVIFFSGYRPPRPTGVVVSAVGAALVGTATGSTSMSVAIQLLWFKATACFYAPSAVLAGQMAVAPWFSAAARKNYVMSPWLSGHAVIWAAAAVTAELRARCRYALTRREFQSLSALDDLELRAIFDKYDTSGDGFLDALELRLALRAAMGTDRPLRECRKLVAAIDADGNGVVEFDEFQGVCRSGLH